MEFVKVAEGNDLEVYQAMRRVQGTPLPTGGVKEALVPFLPEVVTESVVKTTLKAFADRQIVAVSVSATGGISVRVLPRLCGECGGPVEETHRFCPDCGAPVEEG